MVKRIVTPPLMAYIKKNLFRVRSGDMVEDSSLIENMRTITMAKVIRGMAKVLGDMNIISLEANLTV